MSKDLVYFESVGIFEESRFGFLFSSTCVCVVISFFFSFELLHLGLAPHYTMSYDQGFFKMMQISLGHGLQTANHVHSNK